MWFWSDDRWGMVIIVQTSKETITQVLYNQVSGGFLVFSLMAVILFAGAVYCSL